MLEAYLPFRVLWGYPDTKKDSVKLRDGYYSRISIIFTMNARKLGLLTKPEVEAAEYNFTLYVTHCELFLRFPATFSLLWKIGTCWLTKTIRK